jgi:4-azaleucine resistance transporter AzlC
MDRSSTKNPLFRGMRLGIPIAVGYFSAAAAFGILARSQGLSALEAIVFSVSNFAGASQFMAVRMIGAQAQAAEIFIAVFMVNFRYFLMGTSISRKLEHLGPAQRVLAAFVDTDENFAVASLEPGVLPFRLFLGSGLVAYSGWIGGTAVGAIAGSFLPSGVQSALAGTLYAFFAALLAPELKKGGEIVVAAASAAAANVGLAYFLKLPMGWAMVISIAFGAACGLAYGMVFGKGGAE